MQKMLDEDESESPKLDPAAGVAASDVALRPNALDKLLRQVSEAIEQALEKDKPLNIEQETIETFLRAAKELEKAAEKEKSHEQAREPRKTQPLKHLSEDIPPVPEIEFNPETEIDVGNLKPPAKEDTPEQSQAHKR